MGREFRHPLKHAHQVGSAKSGSAGWLAMQFTSVVLIVLTLWVVVLVLGLLHADYASARAAVGHPLNALVLITFVIVLCWHTHLGLHNIYEDYLHTLRIAYWASLLTRLALVLIAVAAVLAILRIALARAEPPAFAGRTRPTGSAWRRCLRIPGAAAAGCAQLREGWSEAATRCSSSPMVKGFII